MFAPHIFGNRIIGCPKILITPEAFRSMACLVDLCDQEVGWLGTVSRIGNDFLIEEIFLLKQKVNSSTTEITVEGFTEFISENLLGEGGLNLVQKLRFWGHSHVNMGTSPSGQDDQQMQVFAGDCQDFFIRGILNKRGRMEFTLYLYSVGIEIEDVPWSIYDPIQEAEKGKWQTEISQKVEKMVYHYPYDAQGSGKFFFGNETDIYGSPQKKRRAKQ